MAFRRLAKERVKGVHSRLGYQKKEKGKRTFLKLLSTNNIYIKQILVRKIE